MKKTILIFSLFLVQANCFSQWYLQSSGTTSALRDVQFINRNTGWCCGENGVILKTTNGGNNWFSQSTGVPTKPLFGISPINDSIVYAVGFFETILKTTNGGTNWIAIENGRGLDSYYCCYFINEQTGWIGTSFPGTKKTTNGGESFINQLFFDIPRDMYFKDSLNGVYCTGGGGVGKTTNGGTNWTIMIISTPGIGDEDFKRISFINNFTGYIVGAGGTTYKTINFGESWDSVGFITQNTNFIHSSQFINDSVGYAGGGNQIFKTTTGGKSWKLQNVSGTGFLPSVYCYNDSIVWVVGNPGHIWFTSSGGQTSINQISEIIPENFKLSQNYPNPFNPATKINYELRVTNYVILNVYDVNGRLVKELVNEKQSAGNYEVNFDGTGLPSGTYIYRLQAGDFSETKKMVLLK